ncbi:hypothetical protein FOPE_08257 [Fonsecaea pedrosoi]|nr:hypothetical protein FOPE_08257 [Fonsecaea pedrosoi]
MSNSQYTFVVEHLDPELGPWSALEYKAIAKESRQAGCRFILSSLPESLLKSEDLKDLVALDAGAESESIETSLAHKKDKICLLDPAAKQELHPTDAAVFEIFLFGGILGDDPPRAPLDKIPYVDFPELKVDEHESTEMPFRYVADNTGKPIMPEGMIELIKADADKAFDNLEFADEVTGLDQLEVRP